MEGRLRLRRNIILLAILSISYYRSISAALGGILDQMEQYQLIIETIHYVTSSLKSHADAMYTVIVTYFSSDFLGYLQHN